MPQTENPAAAPAVDNKPLAAEEAKIAEESVQETVSQPGGFKNDPDDPSDPNEAIERARRKLRP